MEFVELNLFHKSKVSIGLWFLGNSDYFHVKDWIQDTFTAHSLLPPKPSASFIFIFKYRPGIT